MINHQKVEIIRFLHIPKTAGTSLSHLLDRFYRGDHFVFTGRTVEDLERYHELDAAAQARIVLFSGHAPLITGEPGIDSIPTITLLRDPIARAQSYCQHVREGKSQELSDRFPPNRFDLGKFLSSGDRQLQNLQTRYLLGNIQYDIPKEDPDVLVAKAIDLLVNHIKCFGIVEYFDESLLLFRRKLGWRWPVYRRYNVKNRSKLLHFNDEHLSRLRKLNHIDIQIYNAALRVFKEQMRENSDYLDADLKQFRSRQKLHEHLPNISYYMKRSRNYIRKMRSRFAS